MPRAFPLEWPEGQPRTQHRVASRFKKSFSAALEGLRDELKRGGVTGVLVSCNLPPARDGWPDPRAPLHQSDPGVAVYWRKNQKTYVLACDAWYNVEDNLHAIALTLHADRGKVRWRCSAIESRSMEAYVALPEPLRWWAVLGVPRESQLDEIRAIYRLRARQFHPDQVHTEAGRKQAEEKMREINLAMEAAEKEKARGQSQAG